MFAGTTSMASLTFSGTLPESITAMSSLSGWDTSNVEDMSFMFQVASSLTSVDMTGWDTSSVTDLWGMFNSAVSLKSLDLSSWNTSSVTRMQGMFTNTTSLRQLTLGENFRFVGSAGLTSLRMTAPFTGSWQNVGGGFLCDPQGEHIFRSDRLMSNYDGTMADTFVWQRTISDCDCDIFASDSFANNGDMLGAPWRLYNCGILVVDGGYINTISAQSSGWHEYNSRIKRIVFTENITAGTSLVGLFSSLPRLAEIRGLERFNTSRVTNMSRMFALSNSLTSLNFTGRDITPMSETSAWNTSNVTNMSEMFFGASELTALDLSAWDTRNVTDMTNMFAGTLSLQTLILGTDFRFIGVPNLPPVPLNESFGGFWQNLGEGTSNNPLGDYVFTSLQLTDFYSDQSFSDTWIWQKSPIATLRAQLSALIIDATSLLDNTYVNTHPNIPEGAYHAPRTALENFKAAIEDARKVYYGIFHGA
jgi:surface protein